MRGGGIDDLIKNTIEIVKSELPEDIEEVNCSHNNEPGCIKCNICGTVSGTLRQLFHFPNCKYSLKNQNPIGPFIEGDYTSSKIKINPSDSVCILQREYGIVNENSEKTIIGTYGAGPCVILCMREKNTPYKTMLAHIDSLTETPLEIFFQNFKPTETEIYIIGGDNSSKNSINKMLRQLKTKNFTNIMYAHLIDDSSNSFAIDCKAGNFWLNKDVNFRDLPLVYEEVTRKLFFEKIVGSGMPTKLNKVTIPSIV
jgi:hypothetical protein